MTVPLTASPLPPEAALPSATAPVTPAPAVQPGPANSHAEAHDLGHRLGRIDGRLDLIIATLERPAVADGSDGVA